MVFDRKKKIAAGVLGLSLVGALLWYTGRPITTPPPPAPTAVTQVQAAPAPPPPPPAPTGPVLDSCGYFHNCPERLRPLTIETYVNELTQQNSLRLLRCDRVVGHNVSTCLTENDYVTFKLPELTQQQVQEGYKVAFLSSPERDRGFTMSSLKEYTTLQEHDIIKDLRIDYAELNTLEGKRLEARGYVVLLKDGKICTSYGVDITVDACPPEAPPEAPVVPPEPPAPPVVPPVIPIEPTSPPVVPPPVVPVPPAPVVPQTPAPPVVPPPVIPPWTITFGPGPTETLVTTPVPVDNKFCPDCTLTTRQEFQGTDYRLGVNYAIPGFGTSFSTIFNNMKINTVETLGALRPFFATELETKGFSFSAVKDFTSNLIRPLIRGGGQFEWTTLSDASTSKTDFGASFFGSGGVLTNVGQRGNVGVDFGLERKAIPVQFAAPSFNTDNIFGHSTVPFVNTFGRYLTLGDRLDFFGAYTWYKPSTTINYESFKGKIENLRDWTAGAGWWFGSNESPFKALLNGSYYRSQYETRDLPLNPSYLDKGWRFGVGFTFR